MFFYSNVETLYHNFVVCISTTVFNLQNSRCIIVESSVPSSFFGTARKAIRFWNGNTKAFNSCWILDLDPQQRCGKKSRLTRGLY